MGVNTGLKSFWLERQAHNSTIEDYKIFACDVASSVTDLIEMAKNVGLEDSEIMKALENLHEHAGENFEAVEQKSNSHYEELPKEICELLEQLIGDINNGVIEPSEIKGRLENIQFFSEVYYEYKAVNNHE
ncbi:hypothetical protein [Ignatzschineria sp. LJL83]